MKGRSNYSMRLLPSAAMALLLAACGGGGGGGGGDDKADAITPFTFITVENADTDTAVFSNQITLAGFKEAQAISITGENAAYCVNLAEDLANEADVCTLAGGEVNAGDTLTLRLVASTDPDTATSMEVTVGNTDEIRHTTSFAVVTRPNTSLPVGVIVVPKLTGIDAGETGITDPVIVDDFVGVLTLDTEDAGVQFSIDGGAFIEGPVALRPGQSFALELEADEEAGATRQAVLVFSNGNNQIEAIVEVQTRNSEAGSPDPFSFGAVTGAALDTDVDASLELAGTFTNLPISISGGQYSIDGGAFTAAPGQVSASQSVAVRLKSSNQYDTATRARVTVGADAQATTGYFEVITEAEPESVNRPDAFSFGKRALLETDAEVQSEAITITGFEGELQVGLAESTSPFSQAEFAVQDGEGAMVRDFSAAAAVMTAGQKLLLRGVAPDAFSASHAIGITVGQGLNAQTGHFVLATRAADTSPVFPSINPANNAQPGSTVTSAPVTVAGFDGNLPVILVNPPATAEARVKIGDGQFVVGPATISDGQTLQIQAKAPAADSTEPHVVVVRVGSGDTAVSRSFSISSRDIIADDFNFPTPVFTGAPGTVASSGDVTLSGFDGDLALDISNVDAGFEVALQVLVNGAEVETPTNVGAGDTVRIVTHTAAVAGSTFAITASLGTVPGTAKTAEFEVHTLDVQANAFSFTPSSVSNADPGQEIVATAVVDGFVGTLTARVTDGTFGVIRDGTLVGAINAEEKSITAGDTLELHVIAAADIGDSITASVQVGTGVNVQQNNIAVTTTDNHAPAIAINFPTPVSTTHGETITLTGSWEDNSGTLDRLQLAHNGEQVTALPPHVIFPDGTHDWQMTVPLIPGPNTIAISAFDAAGLESTASTITVTRDAPFFNSPLSAAFDQENNKMYVLDSADVGHEIYEINLANNARRLVASTVEDDGSITLTHFFAKRLLLDGSRLLLLDVLNVDNNKLVAVDIISGGISDIADGFAEAVSIEKGPADDVFILGKLANADDRARRPAVLRVNATGNADRLDEVTIFSRPDADPGKQVGAGNAWTNTLVDLAYDLNDTLYVYDLSTTNRLFSIDIAGTRTLVNTNGTVAQAVRGVSVDPTSGRVFAVLNRVDDRFIFEIDPNSATPRYDVVRANAGENGVDIDTPEDIITFRRDGVVKFWVADSEQRQGVLEYGSTDGVLAPAVKLAGSGFAFDFPKAMVLDGDRLLVMSDGTIQGVDIATGNRGNADLFATTSQELENLQINSGKLWLSLKDTGLGSLLLPDLGLSPLTLELDADSDWGETTGILIENDVAFVDVDNANVIQRVDLTGSQEPEDIIETFDNDSQLYRFDATRLVHASRNSLELVNLVDKEAVPLLEDNGEMLIESYAHDAGRRLLYLVGGIDSPDANQFGFIDMIVPDAPEAVLIRETVDGSVKMRGYEASIDELFAFTLDAARNRLFAFAGNSADRQLVAINVTPVAVDSDEDGSFDCEELAAEADGCILVRQQTGETVLISRSGERVD